MSVKEEWFRIDWADLKKFCVDVISSREISGINRSVNRRQIRTFLLENRSDWTGYTPGQLKQWLSNGYRSEAIRGLSDFTPPLREKRRLRFVEEGDEFHYDLAAMGEERFMSKFTHVTPIPGVRLEASIMFSANTSSEIVNAYNTWLCKIAYSLESSGIDCQLTLDFPSVSMTQQTARYEYSDGKTLWHNVVRVKKENEQMDFNSWSALLSPAALRSLGFTVGGLHADLKSQDLTGGWGHGIPNEREWKCEYHPDRRVIRVRNPYHKPRNFPADDMTRQFRDCLRQLSGK